MTPPVKSAGGLEPVITVTAAYTIVDDFLVLADATSSGFTVTLPPAVRSVGDPVTVKAITSGTNRVTLAAQAGDTIDGAATVSLGNAASGAAYQSVTVVSDDATWRVV